jgi:linoleoyl-CoA desaturase
MTAKHLNVPEDTMLYLSISREIKDTIDMDKKKANRYFLFKLIFYGSLAVGSYSLIYFIDDTILFLLDFILFGFVTVLLCFNFAHDFSHNAIFRKPFLDNLAFELIYTLVGAHPEAWKQRHEHSHHFAPNVKHFDTDLAITGIIRLIPGSELKWYHRYQHIYAPFAYTSYSFYWVFIKDFIILFRWRHKAFSKTLRYYLVFAAVKSFYILYLLILPLFFCSQGSHIILVAFLLMHMVQSVYTLFTFFITHHVCGSEYPEVDKGGIINTSWFMNQVRSSNDFYPFSRFANFIFGGVNNHIAHHLFPHVSHYYYPQLNTILFRRLKANGINPNVTTYLGGIYSHLRLLKKMSV